MKKKNVKTKNKVLYEVRTSNNINKREDNRDPKGLYTKLSTSSWKKAKNFFWGQVKLMRSGVERNQKDETGVFLCYGDGRVILSETINNLGKVKYPDIKKPAPKRALSEFCAEEPEEIRKEVLPDEISEEVLTEIACSPVFNGMVSLGIGCVSGDLVFRWYPLGKSDIFASVNWALSKIERELNCLLNPLGLLARMSFLGRDTGIEFSVNAVKDAVPDLEKEGKLFEIRELIEDSVKA